MDYIEYTNEDVKTWWPAQQSYDNVEDLYDAFMYKQDKQFYYHDLTVGVVFDYIEPGSDKKEHLLIRGKIIDIQNLENGDASITWVKDKARGEMKDKYDLNGERCVNLFSSLKFININDDIRLSMIMALGTPIFMQDCDNRLICKHEEAWPEMYKYNEK